MIPKTIHCVWLSGEDKPLALQQCFDSWKKHMPDFEIKEWTLKNLPQTVTNHPFVKEAINHKKWAFATDYIRVWALYNYGGIYFDLDVEVFKSFTPFLKHRAFSCIEFNPRNFYAYIKKRNTDYVRGLNIEAAVLGSEKYHPWIKDILMYYDHVFFSTDTRIIESLIMPLIVTKASIPYGFRYVPIYQVLENDVHIYPPDTFSSCYDLSITRRDDNLLGENVVRYSIHKCAHSWFEDKKTYAHTCSYTLKHFVLRMVGKKTVDRLKQKFNSNVIFRKL